MTPEEIDKLESGRELDEAILVHVFNETKDKWHFRPSWSSDIKEAWFVVEAMKVKGYSVTIWDCTPNSSIPAPGVLMSRGVYPPDRCGEHEARALFESVPVCICRCALRAIFATKAKEPPCQTCLRESSATQGRRRRHARTAGGAAGAGGGSVTRSGEAGSQEMNERLPMQTIEIRNRAVDIVIAAFREAGIDPKKAIRNPMAVQMTLEWRNGNWTREQFLKACRNLLILNPGLAK